MSNHRGNEQDLDSEDLLMNEDFDILDDNIEEDEQEERSARLGADIRHIQRRMADLQLPVASVAATPIWFVWTGGHLQAIELVKRLMADGFYANPSAFPAVPMGHGGVRFTNTLYHSIDQIDALLDSLARHAPELMTPVDDRIELASAGE